MANREEEFLELLQGIGQKAQPINPLAVDKDQEGDSTSVSIETDVKESKPKQEQGAPPTPVPFSTKNVFMHHDTHPLLLGAMLLEKYGPSWLEWEPETLWAEIKDDFNQPTISVHNRNKIQAVKTLHIVDTPWTEWEVFTPVCHALVNNIPDFRTLHKLTPAQLMSSVFMINKVRQKEFGDEINKFVAACFLDDGVYYLPPPVDFAQKDALLLRYRCTKCGNIDRDDTSASCAYCGAPVQYIAKIPRFNTSPVRVRFESRLKSSLEGKEPSELQENEVDVQVAKLLVAHDYMLDNNRKLEEQARVVGHAGT